MATWPEHCGERTCTMIEEEPNSPVSADIKRQAAITYNTTEKHVSDDVLEQQRGTWRFWRRRRLVVAILAFFGFFNVYALRVNLSVAVVAMTEPIQTLLPNGTIVEEPEFNWDPSLKGVVLSSFFYGYIATQIPGGYLASSFGGNRVFAIGVGMTSLLTLFTPPLAHTSTSLLIVVRVFEGLFEGVTYPCIHAVWSRWAPPAERARLATLAFSGSYAGTVVSLPLSSLLASQTGWPSIFYVFGIIGLVWTTIWWLVVKEGPEKDPHITPAELKYIQDSLGNENVINNNIHHPWKKILTSAPVWAIVMAHFSENWGFYTLLAFLPTFMRDVFHFEVSSTGWVSAVPYLAMAAILQLAGHLADWMRVRKILSTTNIRKLFNCGAFLAQTIFMILAAYSSNVVGCVACLTIAVGLGGFAWSGFSVNHLDIAAPHASVLMGLSNTIATLPGIVSPYIASVIVTNKTAEQWRIVFFISSFIYLVGAVIYGVCCSAKKQPWVVEFTNDNTFDTDATSVNTMPSDRDSYAYGNKGLDRNSEL